MKHKPETTTNWPSLGAALERGRNVEQELKTCDPATHRQLIAAWKEELIQKFVEVVARVDDVEVLQSLDRNIAVAEDSISIGRPAAQRAQRRPEIEKE